MARPRVYSSNADRQKAYRARVEVRSKLDLLRSKLDSGEILKRSTGPAPKKQSVHFSSATPEWATPVDLFQDLDREFGFTLDPCSTDLNAKCTKHYTKADDGLAQDWSSDVVFMNPPYGREIGRWMRKAYEESLKGAVVVALIPSKTGPRWWWDWVEGKAEVRNVRGRIKFGGSPHNAPFDSALVIYRPPVQGI